jgi:hypothetical protein
MRGGVPAGGADGVLIDETTSSLGGGGGGSDLFRDFLAATGGRLDVFGTECCGSIGVVLFPVVLGVGFARKAGDGDSSTVTWPGSALGVHENPEDTASGDCV